jgi:hypothetical protein
MAGATTRTNHSPQASNDEDQEITRSFELESFALAFAEGQRIRLGLSHFKRI